MMLKVVVIGVILAGFLGQPSVASSSPPAQHGTQTNTSNNTSHDKAHDIPSFNVATFDFNHVAGPFTIMLWILIASFAKLGFHLSFMLESVFPESSLVIILGVIFGGIIRLSGLTTEDVPFFSSDIFFLFMLPPIVLEAGYFLQDRAFFDNIGTILLFAVVGTLFNAFTVGFTLYGVSHIIGIPLMHYLVFGVLISAVDPVAVLAVFEEVNVNVMLYIIVFGESLLNDAVTVVLYHLFEKLSEMDEVTHKEILLGFANFLVVSLGGTLMGVLWGFFTAFVTKYTDHVRVIEPIFVFIMSYMAYLCAEMFHLSGILSIVTCAIVMKPYVEMNISRKSHTTIKYFMKMLSSCSETLIFLFLGIALVTYDHVWSTELVFLTLLFISVYRAIGVVFLTYLANRFGRLNKLSGVDQFIMCYGGIRGAVSFSLAILLNPKHFPDKGMLVTTTIVVVIFTIFVQGTTIKPIVKALNVKLQEHKKPSMYKELNDKFLEHLVAGIEEVSGFRGHGYYWALMEYIHMRYLRPWFIRDDDSCIHDKDLLLAYRRLEYKDALTHLEREGSGSLLFTSKANSIEQEEDPLVLRGGSLVRCPDTVLRDLKIATGEPPLEFEFYNTHQSLSSLLAYSRTYRHRKFNRNNLVDDGMDVVPSYLAQPARSAFRYIPGTTDRMNMRPKHKKHKRRKRGHHKRHELEGQPPKKKLSTIFEPEEGELNAEKKEDDEHNERLKRDDDVDHADNTATKKKTDSKDSNRTRKDSESSTGSDDGISFSAGRHWRLGRIPSFEGASYEEKDSASDSSREDDNRHSPQPSPRPKHDGKEDIPLVSFVVDMEDTHAKDVGKSAEETV
ncbi:Na(+)/H(+) exchanger beta isoform X2 [Nematostella vectensis]|uniref:Na(+)/H(+) exchanger beta isoform X2 n=1 Tax=Nematostella vectensis TaxID=45351 RepID=UPI00139017DD|nr:Na(+)/H(+) exchanger beta isoform X2 [Nematostella vectensis]